MSFLSKQTIIAVAIGAFLGYLAFGILWRPVRYVDISTLYAPEGEKDCTVTEVEQTVTGSSLGKLLPSGSEVTLLKNYYACKDAERNDIVEYDYPGSDTPIAKRVVGVPGDEFALAKDHVGGTGYNILINGQVAETSEGEPYVLTGRPLGVLELYVKDYKGIIPADAYLILGDLPGGSLDSTEFGLVGKDSLEGKIQK